MVLWDNEKYFLENRPQDGIPEPKRWEEASPWRIVLQKKKVT